MSATPTTPSEPAKRGPAAPRRGVDRIALALAALWVIALLVIIGLTVSLKLGGTEAIRESPERSSRTPSP